MQLIVRIRTIEYADGTFCPEIHIDEDYGNSVEVQILTPSFESGLATADAAIEAGKQIVPQVLRDKYGEGIKFHWGTEE